MEQLAALSSDLFQATLGMRGYIKKIKKTGCAIKEGKVSGYSHHYYSADSAVISDGNYESLEAAFGVVSVEIVFSEMMTR